MEKIFLKHKKKIDSEVKKMASEIAGLDLSWSKDISNSLSNFIVSGKGIRGGLILFTLELFKQKISKDAIKIAAVIEYLHSSLLIQDDIMDHDEKRRGQETMHIRYKNLGKKLKIKDSDDFGKSMGICIADIAIFFSHWYLTSLKNQNNKEKIEIYKIISQEFSLVGFGQVQDLVFAHRKEIPSVKEVLEMYTYKTARYTFSLPITIGAVLAGRNKKDIKKLEEIALDLGLIFQLTDDALTLSGQAKKVGKAIGNDISENKKTLYHILLRKKANRQDIKTISKIFGKANVDKEDIKTIKDLIVFYKIDKDIETRIENYKKRVEKNIGELKLEKKSKEKFLQLLNFLLKREK